MPQVVYSDPEINYFITPDHIADHYWAKVEGYRDLGVDRLMCFLQIADLPQEMILTGMRNVGKFLIPHFDR